MRPTLLLLAAAAAAIAAPPAAAQSLPAAGFTAGPAFASTGSGGTSEGIGNATRSGAGVRVHHGDGWERDRRGRHRGGDRDFASVYVAPRDGYDLNRNWASDSYNDWWHDRPDRAFPRWMAANQDCQRQWWSGGGWRC